MVCHWVVVDGDSKSFVEVSARSQREAVEKTLDESVVPGKSRDVRPRTCDKSVMSEDEFQSFMASLYKGWES